MQIYAFILPKHGTIDDFYLKARYFYTIYGIFSKFVTKIFGKKGIFHTFALKLILNI